MCGTAGEAWITIVNSKTPEPSWTMSAGWVHVASEGSDAACRCQVGGALHGSNCLKTGQAGQRAHCIAKLLQAQPATHIRNTLGNTQGSLFQKRLGVIALQIWA